MAQKPGWSCKTSPSCTSCPTWTPWEVLDVGFAEERKQEGWKWEVPTWLFSVL